MPGKEFHIFPADDDNLGSEQQDSLSASNNMWGVHLPEGQNKGYVLIKDLGGGYYGTTMLALSLTDGKIYVRKCENTSSDRSPATVQSAEEYGVPRSVWQTEPQVKTTTTWEFCNGGTVCHLRTTLSSTTTSDLFRRGLPTDTDLRIPEAFIWRFMDKMLETFIFVHRQGIVHGDAHDSNLFLHWPQTTSPLPDVFVGDFGMSRKYPWSDHPNVQAREPWQVFNLSELDRFAIQHGDRNYRVSDVRDWYYRVNHDISNIFETTFQLMTCGPYAQERLETHLRDAALANRGLNGYSAYLTSVVLSAYNLLHDCSRGIHPRLTMTRLTDMHQSIRVAAHSSETAFARSGFPHGNVCQMFRPRLPNPRPATWSTPESVAIWGPGRFDATIDGCSSSGSRRDWSLELDSSQFSVKRIRPTVDGSVVPWEVVEEEGKGGEEGGGGEDHNSNENS